MTSTRGEAADVTASRGYADPRIEALDAATRAISELADVDIALQVIVDHVRDLVGARYAALGIVDRYGFIEQFITRGIERDVRERIGAPPVGHGLLGLIIREHRSYRIPVIAGHPDSSGFPPNHPPMRSFLGVPVVLEGRAIGNFYLTDKVDAVEFSEDDQRLVEVFARHAAIAIDNARLHAQVRRLAVDDERERIGRDLHDGIIQTLYAVALSLEDVGELMADDRRAAEERVDRAIDSLNDAIGDLRNFIYGLRPELLGRTTLIESIRSLTEELRGTALVDVDVVLDPAAADAVASDVEAELLQLAREALSNVARHANASVVEVQLRSDGRDVILVVSDNGVGFDPARPRSGEHQGLANMARRVSSLDGRLVVESSVGQGTRIIVRVPRSVGTDTPREDAP